MAVAGARETHIWEKSYPAGVDWHAAIPARPMPELFDEWVAKHAALPCIDFLDKKYSYREAGEITDRVARGLQRLGVTKGTTVGLLLPNTPYFVFGYYGILKAGGTVVNFNPLYAEKELVKQIEDSQVDIMFCLDVAAIYDKLAKMLGQTRLKKIVVCRMQDILPFPKNLLFPFVKAKDLGKIPADQHHVRFKDLTANDGRYDKVPVNPVEDVAVLQYTGGTTGVPKGAMLTHANLSANTAQIRMWFPEAREGQERMLGVLPLFHVFAMTGVMNLTIRLGGEMILLPRFELEQVLKTIDAKKPTLFPAVPTIYTAINNHKERDRYDLSSIRFCISGGAPLPVDVKETFERVTGCSLVEGYGLSETSPVAVVNPMGGVSKPGSIGLPVPGTRIEIVDLDDLSTPVPQGERGEICIVGPQVMKGYWNRPDETAKVLSPDGLLHTGDVGTMDADGFVFIVDRIKDMIIASGFKVYPRMVEEAIYLHPAVEETIVIGVDDPYRGQAPKAFIKVKKGMTLTEAEIREFLKDKLSKIEVPEHYEFRDELPKTLIGKLSKKELKQEEAAKEPAREEAP